MNKIVLIVFLLFVCNGFLNCAYGREIHVSILALPGGDGTLEMPYTTIQAAASLAKPGDKVIIHAGTYRETVTPAVSGTSVARIIYMPYNNDSVVIDGSDPVASWTVHNGQIFRAAMNWDLAGENQVFVNDTMAHLARWPNVVSEVDPFFTFSSYSKAGTGSIKGKIIDNTLPIMPDNFYKGCILWGNFGVKWTAFGTRVLSSTGNQLTYSGGDDVHRPFAAPYSPLLATDREMYFLAGKYELLDAPNEWFLDPVKDSIYLWVKDGVDPNTSVKVKRRTLAFNLNGKSYITVKNIYVFASTITMNNCNYCVLDGINAKYITHHSMDGVGTYALRFQQLKDRCGINFSGQSDSVINCTIKYSAGTGVTIGSGSNHVVDNNDIQYCNYVNSYCEGINSTFGTGTNVKITRNKIWYAGGPLINCGRDNPTNNKGNLVFYNDLAYGEQLGDDRGGINGSAYEVAYNWVHDIGRGLGSGIVPGLYTDVSSDYATYHHNVVWNLVGNTTAHILINNTGNPANGNQQIYIYNNTGMGQGWGATMVAGLWQIIITEKNDFCNAPASNFINSSKGDFRLKTGSSAIDKGVIISGITDGYVGTKPDLGAYEFGKTDGSSDWKAGIGVEMYYPSIGFPIGIEEKDYQNSKSSVFPNPASEWIKIQNVEQNSLVTISTIEGKNVYQNLISSSCESLIDIRNLRKGIYILSLKKDSAVETRKIIIQ